MSQIPTSMVEAKSRLSGCMLNLKQRSGSCRLWLILWAFSLPASSTARAFDPADAVPDSASVVFRWKAPQATVGKLADYIDAVQQGFGTIIKGSLPTVGQTISIPQSNLIDFENDWWAIVFANSDDGAAVVYVIPTTDVKAVEAALPDEFEFYAEGNLAIYSTSEEALEKVRDRISGKGTKIWSKLNAASKTLFDTSDLSVLANVRQLSQGYQDELAQAEPQLDKSLDDLLNLMPEAQRPQLAAAFDVYRMLGKVGLQGVKDSNIFTFGLTITKDVIRFEDRLQVDDKTPTARFLASQPPGDLPMIGRLPATKSGYIAVSLDMAGMVDYSMKMTKAILTSLTDEQKAEFDKAVEGMKGLKYGDLAWYFDLDPTGPSALRAGSVVDVAPTDRMREITRSLTKSMAAIEAVGFTQTTTLEPAAVKVGGVDVDRVTIKQDIDETADPQGFQKKFRTMLFGEDGMQQLVMYQPKRVLQTFGGGATEMQRLVTALNSTATNETAIVTTARKRLVEKANVIVLVDVVRLIASGAKLASKEGVIPIDAKAIDDLKLPTSFMGFSIAFESNSARSQFEIPVAQTDGIVKLVNLLMNARR